MAFPGAAALSASPLPAACARDGGSPCAAPFSAWTWLSCAQKRQLRGAAVLGAPLAGELRAAPALASSQPVPASPGRGVASAHGRPQLQKPLPQRRRPLHSEAARGFSADAAWRAWAGSERFASLLRTAGRRGLCGTVGRKATEELPGAAGPLIRRGRYGWRGLAAALQVPGRNLAAPGLRVPGRSLGVGALRNKAHRRVRPFLAHQGSSERVACVGCPGSDQGLEFCSASVGTKPLPGDQIQGPSPREGSTCLGNPLCRHYVFHPL